MAQGALASLTVLDLSRGLAGPFCAQVMADHGANVIKIEEPSGDQARELGPFMADDRLRAFGGYFQSVNRNKRSIVLDLKQPGARDALQKLVLKADVLLENYRAGVMEKFGLGYETLATLNPKLVYAAIRGYGDPRSGESPYADWPAFDVTAQAAGGFIGITGPDAEHASRAGPSIGDIVPGLFTGFGILSAVLEARLSGRGQFLDVSMYDAIVALCERAIYRYTYTGHVSQPEGNNHPLLRPFGVFPAKDGMVSIAGGQGRLWRELCALMGQPELADDPRFAQLEDRLKNSDALSAAIGAWSRQFTKRELATKLGGKIPFAPVNTAKDIVEDPHIAARGMLAAVEHPGSAQPARIVATPIHLSRTPGSVRSRAPTLGEHTQEVLSQFGFSDAEIAALLKSGAAR